MEKSLKDLEKQVKKVSFVVPIYKTEKYLEKCLKSLIDQDYKNIEIICVADGKSDKAKKIFDKLKKDNQTLREYLTVPHGGAPKARNAGYEFVEGDYVSFWDSDCYAEPGMTRMWVKSFLMDKRIDFVYSGYRFNDENMTFVASRPFDEYAITTDNYIATMFPMKTEIFPGFDESLESLQDWDLWLTLVEKGHKGFFLAGSAFTTEARKGISSVGCTDEMWLSRYNKVRKKHFINNRDICFSSQTYDKRALELAKMFKQDFRYMPSHKPNEYKLIYQIGFFAHQMEVSSSVFKNAPKGCKKYIHFLGEDIESLFMLPYRAVKPLVDTLKDTIDGFYCEDIVAQSMLLEIGIDAKILPLPMEYKKTGRARKFKIYYEFDTNEYKSLYEEIQKAVPMYTIESVPSCNVKDYACFISITQSKFPSENLKTFGASGKEIITNHRMAFANTIEPKKEDIVNAIFEAHKNWESKKVDKTRVDYFRKLIDDKEFKKEIYSNAGLDVCSTSI